MSVNSKMTAIANAVRDLRGMSGTMGLDAMATNISGAKTAVDAALAALTEKGVTVPDGTKVDGLAALIAAIEAGGDGLTMARGEYTPAENQTDAIIEHGLGKIPSLFILLAKTTYLKETSYLWFACGFRRGQAFNPDNQHTAVIAVSGHNNYSSKISSTVSAMVPGNNSGSYLILPTINTITYSGGKMSLKAGTTYAWYAVA